jgi:hypothetical protein
MEGVAEGVGVGVGVAVGVGVGEVVWLGEAAFSVTVAFLAVMVSMVAPVSTNWEVLVVKVRAEVMALWVLAARLRVAILKVPAGLLPMVVGSAATVTDTFPVELALVIEVTLITFLKAGLLNKTSWVSLTNLGSKVRSRWTKAVL